MTATRSLANPIPRLAHFYRDAKSVQSDEDEIMTAEDWSDVSFIIENESHAEFSCRSLANLLHVIVLKRDRWESLEKRNLANPIIASILNHLPQGKAREIATLLHDLAYSHIGSETFLQSNLDESFVAAIKKHIYDFNALDLADMLSAYVVLDFNWQQLKDRKLDKLILIALQKNLDDLDEQSVSSILWSLAHLGLTWDELQDYQLAKPLLNTIEINYSQIDAVQLRRIKQAQLWFDFELKDDIQQDLDDELRKMPKPRSSNTHLGISAWMQTLTKEKIINEKCYGLVLWVDIGFENYDVCFEYDGPSHEPYLDRFKTALLQKLGVTVDRINYKDDVTRAFLQEKLIKNDIPVIGFENHALKENSASHSSPGISATNRKASKKAKQKNKRSELNAFIDELTEAKSTLSEHQTQPIDIKKNNTAGSSERKLIQKLVRKDSKTNVVPKQNPVTKKSALCTFSFYAVSAVASLVAINGAMNVAADYIEKKYF